MLTILVMSVADFGMVTTDTTDVASGSSGSSGVQDVTTGTTSSVEHMVVEVPVQADAQEGSTHFAHSSNHCNTTQHVEREDCWSYS